MHFWFYIFRMVLYPLAGFLAGAGFGAFNEDNGDFTFNLEQLASVLAGAAIWAAAWVSSRYAKSRNWWT